MRSIQILVYAIPIVTQTYIQYIDLISRCEGDDINTSVARNLSHTALAIRLDIIFDPHNDRELRVSSAKELMAYFVHQVNVP